MAVISGQRQTGNVGSDQRFIDIAKPIMLLEPDATPLVRLTKAVQKGGRVKSAGDYKFSWVEKERDTRFDAVNNGAGYAEGATEIKVDNEELFYVKALVKVPRTGEIMLVSAVESEKITVSRGFAGTSKAALVDNDPLFIVGAVAEEGSRSLTARSRNPETVSNYLEIFKTSIEASGSWLSSDNQTSPHDWVEEHREKNIEHLLDIEHAALFGSASTSTGAEGGRLSTTGGALSFLTANNQDAGGALTEAEFESFVRSICRYGSNKKTLFASPLLLSVINNYAVGRLQTIQADKDSTYGISVMEYICAHGTIKLVKHNLLEGAVWGGYGIALDMKSAPPGYRYLKGQDSPKGGRDTKLYANRQENDRDGQKDEIITECGFSWPQPKTGGVLTGVTS